MTELEIYKRKAEKMSALLEVGKSISAEMNLDNLLRIIMEKTTFLLNADRCTLFLLDEEKEELWSRIGVGLESNEIRFNMRLGIAGHVATIGETINIPEAYEDPRFNPAIDKKTGYRTKTILCMPMRNKEGKVIGVFQVLNKFDDVFNSEDEELLQALSAQAGIVVENAILYEEHDKQFKSMLEVLAATIDARDPYTAGHSHRVTEYSLGIAEELNNIDTKDKEILKVSALLHDYGKIGVDDAILRKPGKLTDEEFNQIKQHAAKTKEILEKMYFARDYRGVPSIASCHHEKLDGTGYPSGVKGDSVPFEAKIIAVADF